MDGSLYQTYLTTFAAARAAAGKDRARLDQLVREIALLSRARRLASEVALEDARSASQPRGESEFVRELVRLLRPAGTEICRIQLVGKTAAPADGHAAPAARHDARPAIPPAEPRAAIR